MAGDDDFFDEDIGWDDETAGRGGRDDPDDLAKTQERRTLAGDIERLRRQAQTGPRLRLYAALAVALVVLLIVIVLVVTSGSSTKAPPPTTQAATKTAPATTAAPPPAPAITVAAATPLKPGDQGPAVKTLQRALRRLGLLTAAADGIYGPQTQAAVTSFQSSHGLTADGVVGKKTAQALNAALASAG